MSPCLCLVQGDFPDYIPTKTTAEESGEDGDDKDKEEEDGEELEELETKKLEEVYGNFYVRVEEERVENNYTCRKILLRNDEIPVSCKE